MFFYRTLVLLSATAVLAQQTDQELESLLLEIFGEPCDLGGGVSGFCTTQDKCHVTTTELRRVPCTDASHVCCIKKTSPPKLDSQGCGRRNPIDIPTLSQTKLGNDKAKFGEFPWTASLFRKETIQKDGDNITINLYVSGASIIHPSVVLTAAHKVSNLQNLVVRGGEWDTQTNDEPYPHQDRDVQEILIHNEFATRNFANDIALLFLKKPLELAPNVATVCLPQQDVTPVAGTRCFSSGWGKNTTGKTGKYQQVMKKIELPAFEHSTCQDVLRTTRLSKFFKLHPTFLCAGGEEGQDTCEGDGGSPLVCPVENQNDRYMQSGIVAWGIDCGGNGIPAVYVNVASFRKWIDDNVIARGYDTNAYSY